MRDATKTKFEDEIIKDIRGLPEHLQGKLAKTIHFFTKEVIAPMTIIEKLQRIFYRSAACGKMTEAQKSRYRRLMQAERQPGEYLLKYLFDTNTCSSLLKGN